MGVGPKDETVALGRIFGFYVGDDAGQLAGRSGIGLGVFPDGLRALFGDPQQAGCAVARIVIDDEVDVFVLDLVAVVGFHIGQVGPGVGGQVVGGGDVHQHSAAGRVFVVRFGAGGQGGAKE